MCVCVYVCGKLRALSHNQSDVRVRKGVTGCFKIRLIFIHAISIEEEEEILESLLPGPGGLRPCHHHLQCPAPYPVVCRHERSPRPPGHHSGGHSGHHLLLEEIQHPRPGNGLYDQLPKVKEHILKWDPCVTQRLVAFNE